MPIVIIASIPNSIRLPLIIALKAIFSIYHGYDQKVGIKNKGITVIK